MEKTEQYRTEPLSLRCDLHTHSVFSDGTYTPGEIIAEARRMGLIIALTDHNTASGLPEFMAAGEHSAVRTVPGIEFSTDYRGKELHIVGLFLQPETFGEITDFLSVINRRKEESNRK